MARFLNIILSMCFLGLLLFPGEALACLKLAANTIQSEESCCLETTKEEHNQQTCEKECCKDKSSESDKNADCSSNCSSNSCHSTPTTFWMLDLQGSSHTFLFENKLTVPIYNQPYYSLLVYAIWQPPKIV